MKGRPLLFYSAWPLGYHNREAERKARGFAQAGCDVLYVSGLGLRNPRPSNVRKLVRLASTRRAGGVSAQAPDAPAGLRTSSLWVAPPRQAPVMRSMNERWIERQLRRRIGRWSDAVAWVRWPSPELVGALARLQPAATVYECVDAYHDTPGVTGRWSARFERAERRLVEQADAVVVPSEPLADRFRAWGASPHLLPHGVDLFPAGSSERRTRPPRSEVTIGFVGTLDYRLDLPVLRHVASSHPEWRVRLIGPVQEGFDPEGLSDLENVSIEPPVPYEEVGAVLSSFDAGIMPYIEGPVYFHMSPVKNLELFAAGRPAVARRNPALARYSELLYFAETPEEFERQLVRALEEDAPLLVQRRRAAAERETWDRRIAEAQTIVQQALRS